MTVPYPNDPRLVVSQPPGTPNSAISLPTPPTSPASYTFPVVATIAPVLGSVLIWAITRSPFALVFAALSPIVAIASLLDARWNGRKHRTRENRRFITQAARTREAIVRFHESEREQLQIVFPSISAVLKSTQGESNRWPEDGGFAALVRIGQGDAQSCLRVDGLPADIRDLHIRDELNQLCAAAACLSRAPIRVDARLGLAICGSPTVAHAVARAYLIRLAGLIHPKNVVIRRSADPAWDWLEGLPHRVELFGSESTLAAGNPGIFQVDRDRCTAIEFVALPVSGELPAKPAPSVLIVVAANPRAVPRSCHYRVSVASASASATATATATLTTAGGTTRESVLELEYASLEDAVAWANQLRRWAEAEGITTAEELPESIPFSALAQPASIDASPASGLGCVIGVGVGSVWRIDLVTDGPHAVIGGTTGSGKSELLLTWILALASGYSPQRVTFLLVDFKGGVSFDAVRHLPHTVGVITDLDPISAARALESLRAELRYRERFLLDAGCKSIDEVSGDSNLPRLIVIVDEFAVLANDFSELRALFADIAARGRSLGMHLILCTQRPADALRESILANCTLRISLRVNGAADSVALIGTAHAAELPREPIGRALIPRSGRPPSAVQVALADTADLSRVAALWPDAAPLRRPWCDPLPAVVTPESLAPARSGIAFALRDLPDEQRQDTAEYDPQRHGNMLIQGARGAGKSTALRTIAAGFTEVCWVPIDCGGAWDTVAGLIAHRSAASQLLVLCDDLDLLVARLGQDHQHEFIDRLARLLREGPARQITVVAGVQQLSSVLSPVGALWESRLILRLTDRHEHFMAGGRSEQFDPSLQPGAGFWGDRRVQLVFTPNGSMGGETIPERVIFDPGQLTAVVSSAPRDFSERLTRSEVAPSVHFIPVRDFSRNSSPHQTLPHEPAPLTVVPEGRHTVVIGDPDDWQAAWSVLGSLPHRQQLLFDRCSVADYRAIARSRGVPPPLSNPGELWRVDSSNRVQRVQIHPSWQTPPD